MSRPMTIDSSRRSGGTQGKLQTFLHRKHPVNSRLRGESAGYSSVSLWFGVDPSSLWASGAHSPCCHSPAVA